MLATKSLMPKIGLIVSSQVDFKIALRKILVSFSDK